MKPRKGRGGWTFWGVFTFLATLLAHRFWGFPGMDRAHGMATLFEHLAIAGGFIVAAVLANGRSGIR